jgi:histidine triad (HIT) family protein
VPERAADPCTFCAIVAGSLAAAVVYEDADFFAFLDNRPLFPGHVLLCPRAHFETLLELPPALSRNTMPLIQLLAQAVELATTAEGSFIAVNNRVSQSVPHLHIHIVPRRRGDGLKGFFWPRAKYESDAALEKTRSAIETEITRLRSSHAVTL